MTTNSHEARTQMTTAEAKIEVRLKPWAGLRPKLPGWLKNNPILLKEMRSRMRGWRSLVGLTTFIGVLSGVVSLIYFSIVPMSNPMQSDIQQMLGRTIFFSIYGIELLMICVMTPAMTAGAISAEKEQQTFDLLRTTLLTARDLVLGKLFAVISYIILFMAAAIPLQAIALIFGGVTVGEVVVSVLIMLVTAFLFGAVGLFFSSFLAKTRIATWVSQLTSIAVVIVIPTLLLILVLTVESKINLTYMSDLGQIALFGVLWMIGISSPAVTALFTEVFLTEKQTLFFFTETLNSGATAYIPSPWLGFIVLYPLLTVLLLYYSIRFVNRAEA